MPFDRTQWNARDREGPTRRERAVAELQLLEQAAVSVEAVTGHPAWDRFLSMISAMIAKFEGMEEAALERISNPGTVDQNELMLAKIALAEARAAKTALQATMKLPSEIINAREIAVDRIEALAADDKDAA